MVHIHNRPELMRSQEDADEIYVDTGKKTIRGALLDGDLGAAKYALSTKGRKYGWGLGIGNSAGADFDENLKITSINFIVFQPDQFAPVGMPSVALSALPSPTDNFDDEQSHHPSRSSFTDHRRRID